MAEEHYKCLCGWHGTNPMQWELEVSCPRCKLDTLDECFLCERCGLFPQSDRADADGLCEYCLTCPESEALARRAAKESR